MKHYYRFVAYHPYLVIGLWIVLAAGVVALQKTGAIPELRAVAISNQAGFLPRTAESQQARAILRQEFPDENYQSLALLIVARDRPLTAQDLDYVGRLSRAARGDRAAIRQVAPKLAKVTPPAAVLGDQVTSLVSVPFAPGVSTHLNPAVQRAMMDQVRSRLISPDRKAVVTIVPLSSGFTSDDTVTAVDYLRRLGAHPRDLHGRPIPGLAVVVGGDASLGHDYMSSLQQSLETTTFITPVLIVALLVLIYRSLVAPLVPLMTIAISVVISQAVIALVPGLGRRLGIDFNISSLVQIFNLVVLFGAGTDYCVFLIWRFREELMTSDNSKWAAAHAMERTTGALVSSAGTVIVGLGCMWFAEFGLFKMTGPSVALGLAIGLIAALSLTPALLAALGPRVNWPRRAQADGWTSHLWEKLARLVCRYPGTILAVTLLVLAVPMAFSVQANRSHDLFQELPPHTQARTSYKVLQDHFNQGEMAPSKVVIQAPTSFRTSTGLTTLYRLSQDLLAEDPSVYEVRSATQPLGSAEEFKKLRPANEIRTARDQIAKGAAAIDLGALAVRAALALGRRAIMAPGGSSPGSSLDPRTLDEVLGNLEQAARALSRGTDQATRLLQGIAVETTGPQASPMSLDLPGVLQSLAATGADARALAGALDAVRRRGEAGAGLARLGALVGRPAGGSDRATAGFLAGLVRELDQALEPAGRMAAQALAADQGMDHLEKDLGAMGVSRIFLPDWLLDAHPELQAVLDRYISAPGTTTKLEVIQRDRPYSPQAFQEVEHLRDEVAELLPSTATVHVAGPNSEINDIRLVTRKDYVRVTAAVLIGVYLILILLLRQPLTSLYLAGTMYLSYLVTLGATTLVFQVWGGHPGLDWKVPFFLFVLLVALGEDYNIFLMARVQEEVPRHGVGRGIEIAVGRTGAIITSCGVIMAGTFIGFLFSHLAVMVQLGFALPLGIILDTFVIRPVVVPCLGLLIDRWSTRLGLGHTAPVPAAEPPLHAPAVDRPSREEVRPS